MYIYIPASWSSLYQCSLSWRVTKHHRSCQFINFVEINIPVEVYLQFIISGARSSQDAISSKRQHVRERAFAKLHVKTISLLYCTWLGRVFYTLREWDVCFIQVETVCRWRRCEIVIYKLLQKMDYIKSLVSTNFRHKCLISSFVFRSYTTATVV